MNGSTKLTNLNPAWWSRYEMNDGAPCALQFDCPICPRGIHRVFIPFVDKVWNQPRMIYRKIGDTFSDVTFSPAISLDTSPCRFRGWITAGDVSW